MTGAEPTPGGSPGPGDSEVKRLEVTEETNDRLDRYLADRFHLSRTLIASLIAEGRVRVGGREVKKRHRPVPGEVIEIHVPASPPLTLEAEEIPLELVYEDEEIAVVEKPAGLVVHPAPGHPGGTLVNALLYHLDRLSGVGGDRRPGIVHRLDRETSGLLVVAKTDEAHLALSEALARRRIRRGYVAAAWGHLGEDARTIDRPIARDPRDRKRMAVVEGGKRAVTHLRRLERWHSAELLAVRLETGRTHQIRVHLRSVGHPVVGDRTYAPRWERGFVGAGGRWAEELARRAGRLFLHAAHLAFRHPRTDRALTFRSKLPEPLASAAAWARDSS